MPLPSHPTASQPSSSSPSSRSSAFGGGPHSSLPSSIAAPAAVLSTQTHCTSSDPRIALGVESLLSLGRLVSAAGAEPAPAPMTLTHKSLPPISTSPACSSSSSSCSSPMPLKMALEGAAARREASTSPAGNGGGGSSPPFLNASSENSCEETSASTTSPMNGDSNGAVVGSPPGQSSPHPYSGNECEKPTRARMEDGTRLEKKRRTSGSPEQLQHQQLQHQQHHQLQHQQLERERERERSKSDGEELRSSSDIIPISSPSLKLSAGLPPVVSPTFFQQYQQQQKQHQQQQKMPSVAPTFFQPQNSLMNAATGAPGGMGVVRFGGMFPLLPTVPTYKPAPTNSCTGNHWDSAEEMTSWTSAEDSEQGEDSGQAGVCVRACVCVCDCVCLCVFVCICVYTFQIIWRELDMKTNKCCSFSGSDREDHNKVQFVDDMLCGICDDKATGLHYGIITCEG